MKVSFEPLLWEDYPSINTPINAENLNRLEAGVAGLYSDVAEIEEKLTDGVGEYVTPKMFGAKGDSETDDVDAFYAMFDWMIENHINIAFVPEGEYHVSKSLAIPENCTLIGTGYDSFIYLSDETDLGVALTNGGSNVSIKNLRVGNIGDTQAIGASGYGGIGISIYSYDTVKSGQLSDKADANNIVIENIYSSGSYPLQVEAGSGCSLENVFVKNVFAPQGLVSNTAGSGSMHNNVHFENIVCDVFRYNYNSGSGRNNSVKNMSCNYLRLNSIGSINFVAKDIEIKTGNDSLYKASFNNNSALYVNGNYAIENVSISNNDNVTYGIYIYDGNSIFRNVRLLNDFGTKNMESRIAVSQTFYNCDLGNVESTAIGRAYSTNITLVGGVTGASPYYDDTTDFTHIPSSSLTNATSDVPNVITRKGNMCHISLCKVLSAAISKGTEIATITYSSFKPSVVRHVKARVFNIDQSLKYDIELLINTDGTITVNNPYPLTLVNSITANRIYVNDFYLL